MSNAVAEKSNYWKDMEIDWHPVRSLLGGTRAMRKPGTVYLPREEAESEKSYRNRLGRSFLYAGLKNAVAELTSKPFQKPVEVKPGLGPKDRKSVV